MCVQYGVLCAGGSWSEQTVFSGQPMGCGRAYGVRAGRSSSLLLEDGPTE